MPTYEEYDYARNNLEKYRASGKKIDYIISHTAPLSGLTYLCKNHGIDEVALNDFLEEVRGMVMDDYIMHFFGHLHIDREMPILKQRALWFDYVEIPLED